MNTLLQDNASINIAPVHSTSRRQSFLTQPYCCALNVTSCTPEENAATSAPKCTRMTNRTFWMVRSGFSAILGGVGSGYNFLKEYFLRHILIARNQTLSSNYKTNASHIDARGAESKSNRRKKLSKQKSSRRRIALIIQIKRSTCTPPKK